MRYGLSIADWNALHAAQGGKCAICIRVSDKLVVDHCHVKQPVRVILCHIDNLTLGQYEDDPTWFRRAADYLEASRATEAA